MKPYKVGITIGIFDLFHRGHLNLVKSAKELCDYLIVGIHSDEYVLKCKHRPSIFSYDDRKAIMESVVYVDEVVKNEAPIDLELCKRIKFDAIFIGDDWKGTPGWKRVEDMFAPLGRTVVYLNYTKCISTTQIREMIAETSISKFEKNKEGLNKQ